MRILYVIEYFYPFVGGVPTLFYNLIKEMKRRGNEVEIITTHLPSTKKSEILEGIKIFRMGRNRESFLIKSVLNLLSKTKKFDLIHTSTYSSIIPSYIFSKIKNLPRILSVHEVWMLKEWIKFTNLKGVLYFLEERSLLSLPFNFYISPSFHTKKDLEKIGISKERIKVIPHGIDKKIFNPNAKKFRKYFRKEVGIGEKEIVGCFIGKPTIFKGINYLIKALQDAFKESYFKFIFLISESHKSGYENFMKKMREFEFKDRVLIMESREDHRFVAKVLGSCDFLVVPSLTEGFGFVAAEALSIGLPVISTRETALEEIVNKKGILVEKENYKMLKDSIVKVVEDEKLRKRYSKPKKFLSWEEVANKYEKIYEELI